MTGDPSNSCTTTKGCPSNNKVDLKLGEMASCACRSLGATRPPVISLLISCGMISAYHLAGADEQPERAWYQSLSSTFWHVDTGHLWINVAIILFVGSLFEINEGVAHMVAVIWGASNLGFAFKAIFTPNASMGGGSSMASGIVFAQALVLLLNWGETPCRKVRLFLLATLASIDVAVFWTSELKDIMCESQGYHIRVAFGALSGMLVALVLGRNAGLHDWEVTLRWVGVLGYGVLVVGAIANDQMAAGLLAALIIPALVVSACAPPSLRPCRILPPIRGEYDPQLSRSSASSTSRRAEREPETQEKADRPPDVIEHVGDRC